MEKKIDDNNQEKIDKNLLLFDKGFNDVEELSTKKRLTQKNQKRKPVNWYTLYKVLFQNTLSSKSLIPKEELKLRLNILRKHLPPYYNVPKTTENSNSNSLLKKFAYHVYPKNNFFKKLLEKSNKKGPIFVFEEGENKEKEINESTSQVFQRRLHKTRTQKFDSSNLNLFNFGQRRGSIRNSRQFEVQDLKLIHEYSPKRNSKAFKDLPKSESPEKRKYKKRTTIRMEASTINRLFLNHKKIKKNANIYFYELERKAKLKLDKQNELSDLDKIDKDYLIRTPNDNEYSLVLSDKRIINNNNRTYFEEYLNKLNLETKNEKINTYKREVSTQLLKFNELYFDSKMEDFGHDKIFSEIKNNCDLFINKFGMDKQEEKIISDLEKFL